MQSRFLALALLAAIPACSSSSPPAVGPVDSAPPAPIVPECDGVVVAMDASSAVLATDGTGVFVLTMAANGHKIVSQIEGGALQQVADVPSDAPDSAYYDPPPQLVADADRFYVTTRQTTTGFIAAADRHDGGVTILTSQLGVGYIPSPTFASDGTYLYFESTLVANQQITIARVPVTGGVTEMVAGPYPPYGTFAVDGAHLYVLGPFMPGHEAENALNLTTHPTPPPDGGDEYNNGVQYELGACTRPGMLVPIDGGVLAACTVDGGAPASIYALSTAPSAAFPVNGTRVVDGEGLDALTYVVVDGNVYYDTSGLAPGDAGATGQPFVYKTPLSNPKGLQPQALLRTKLVSSMVAAGGELYVASACGIQKTAL